MTIRIRLFATMADSAGAHQLSLQLPDHATLADVRPALERQFPRLRFSQGTLLAVNQEYVEPARPLKDNDEVAIIPPVSGG